MDILPAQKNTVVIKGNNILRGRIVNSSVWEERIFSVAISKIQERKQFKGEFSFPASELCIGKDNEHKDLSGSQYKDVKKALETLKSLTIKTIDNQKQNDDMANWKEYRLFITTGFSNGKIVLKFHDDLEHIIMGMKTNFNAYYVSSMLKINSVYAQKMFGMLKSYSNCKYHTMRIEELYDFLSVPDGYKKNFAEFKRAVLVKSYVEIHATNEFDFEYELIKQGRKIVGIKFIFDIDEIYTIRVGKDHTYKKESLLKINKNTPRFKSGKVLKNLINEFLEHSQRSLNEEEKIAIDNEYERIKVFIGASAMNKHTITRIYTQLIQVGAKFPDINHKVEVDLLQFLSDYRDREVVKQIDIKE